jgi:hypothetical protein
VSEENLMTAAKLAEAFNREGWNGLFPFLDPDFEFHEPPEQPGATVFRGHEAARLGWAKWFETWTQQRSEMEDLRELPDGGVLVLTLERMRGRDGIKVEHRAGIL